MARSNPYKKKRRVARRTLLMFGEGLGEEMFLKHLRSLYSRDSGIAVKISNGRGGNVVNIVVDAYNFPGAYDRKIVVIDNDSTLDEMNQARSLAKERGIELIENNPCLEALLLSILNDGKDYTNSKSSWCKHEFESNYLEKKKRADIREYERLFPKQLLDSKKDKLPNLEKFISAMTSID